jgi:antitoxin (DNA-binding transcriptional repressor) of toxin-antitoxin stability system
VKQIKIGEAKSQLSKYLAYVRRGGRVRILDRDTPVADLVPVMEAPVGDDEDRFLAALEHRGLARRGQPGPLPEYFLRPGPRSKGGTVLQALLDDRRSSR